MARESGKGGMLIPLLFLLMLLGGAGGYNYHRNAAAENEEFRPFRSYSDTDLDALAAAYEEQLSGGMESYKQVTSKAVTIREGGLLDDQVREFERVQKFSNAKRTMIGQLAKTQVQLDQLKEEQAKRALDRPIWKRYTRLAFTYKP